MRVPNDRSQFDLQLAVKSQPNGHWKVSIQNKSQPAEPESKRSSNLGMELLKNINISGALLSQPPAPSDQVAANPFFQSLAASRAEIPVATSAPTIENPPVQANASGSLTALHAVFLSSADAPEGLKSLICKFAQAPHMPQTLKPGSVPNQESNAGGEKNSCSGKSGAHREEEKLSPVRSSEHHGGEPTQTNSPSRHSSRWSFSQLQPQKPRQPSVRELAADFIRSLSNYKVPSAQSRHEQQVSQQSQAPARVRPAKLRLNLEKVRCESDRLREYSPQRMMAPSPIEEFMTQSPHQLDSHRSKETHLFESSPSEGSTSPRMLSSDPRLLLKSSPALLPVSQTISSNRHFMGGFTDRDYYPGLTSKSKLLTGNLTVRGFDGNTKQLPSGVNMKRQKNRGLAEGHLSPDSDMLITKPIAANVSELETLLHAERTKARQLQSALVNTVEAEQQLKVQLKELQLEMRILKGQQSDRSVEKFESNAWQSAEYRDICLSLQSVRDWLAMVVQPIDYITTDPANQAGRSKQFTLKGRNYEEVEDIQAMLNQAERIVTSRTTDWGDLNQLMGRITKQLRQTFDY